MSITIDQYRALNSKTTKYRNKITIVDGIRFDSKAEARRWEKLRSWYHQGIITKLGRQPKFPFHIHGKLMFTYIADFKYTDIQTGIEIIEDVKGVKTPMYKLKKKIIEEMYGITITEVM